MKTEVKKILEGFVDQEYPQIPEYAFTVRDYQEMVKEKTGSTPSRTASYRRLDARVEEGELIKKKTVSGHVFYVPAALKKNMELDEDIIKEA